MGLNRYQILNRKTARPIAYRFPSTNSVIRVCEYMKRCMGDQVAFDTNNISSSILDASLVKFSREMKFPVITKTETTARIMSISQGYRKVYSIDAIPETVHFAICYWDLSEPELEKKDVESVLTLFREPEKKKAIS